MQDAFAYCAELVRTADRDRFIAALFAPAERRDALNALYAFNIEIARVRELAHAALPGEIRLQWWSEVIGRTRDEEAQANPVAAALVATMEKHDLAASILLDLIEARRFDLYDETMASAAELETYARRTSSSLFALAAQILAGKEVEAVAEPAGVAYCITAILQAFPHHIARRQLFVPTEYFERHHVNVGDVFAGRSSAGLMAAFDDLRALALDNLAAAADRIGTVPEQVIPALLPIAVTRSTLKRIATSDPFAGAQLSSWRRQWLIWRAARNPTRIAAT